MKPAATPISTTHFRYLSEHDTRPLTCFLKEFCRTETDVEFFRQDMLRLFHAACVPKSAYHENLHHQAESFVYDHKQMIRVLEFLWYITQEEPTLVLPETHPLFQKTRWKRDLIDVEERLSGPAKYYRVLENKEVNNVRSFLDDLFRFKSLAAWRDTLDEILLYAHMDGSIAEEADIAQKLMPIRNYLEKTTEAIFLIADILLPREEIGSNYPLPSLEDENFTASLLQYLLIVWENRDIHHSESSELFFLHTSP